MPGLAATALKSSSLSWGAIKGGVRVGLDYLYARASLLGLLPPAGEDGDPLRSNGEDEGKTKC